MTVAQLALLFVAAATGGALNAVAGGGSFITLPSLIGVGVRAVSANTTSTIAMWSAGVASAIAYRKDVNQGRAVIVGMAAVSLVGGALGALLLLGTSDTTFLLLLPWLLLIATVTFTFGGAVTSRLRARAHGSSTAVVIAGVIAQLAIATYGGYFGGGMGIMMLASMSVMGMTDIHAMNGLKAILGTIINGVAVIAFVIAGSIVWTPAVVMIVGAIAGGFGGAGLARRVPAARMRVVVTVVAWGLTAYFFARAYA